MVGWEDGELSLHLGISKGVDEGLANVGVISVVVLGDRDQVSRACSREQEVRA